MTLQMDADHKDGLVEILANRASLALFGTEQDFFQNLVASSNLPTEYVRGISGGFRGNADYDARRLVDFALGFKVNLNDPHYTVLGSIIVALLKQRPSPEDARTLVAILLGYKLVLDPAKRQNIAVQYMVPLPPDAEVAVTYGPPIAWRGPTQDFELQSFFRPEPKWLDVGFLRRAMQRAASVCRVELGPKSGTGFLVSPTLVLTNFHVLREFPQEDLQLNASQAVLRFGAFSASGSDSEETGRIFKLAANNNIVAQSPVAELDFLLLRVEDPIRTIDSIQPAPLEEANPLSNSPLNILHHPKGGAMKLSLSSNGVTGVYEREGLIQYVTAAAGGSSGSPCFNDNWNVVALHHAQQARSFGSIREGILVGSIYKRIKQYL
jgi:V8-like Glu-specific endopeptidase